MEIRYSDFLILCFVFYNTDGHNLQFWGKVIYIVRFKFLIYAKEGDCVRAYVIIKNQIKV